MKARDLPLNAIQRVKMVICMKCDFKEPERAKCVAMDCNVKAPWKKRNCPFGYWKDALIKLTDS